MHVRFEVHAARAGHNRDVYPGSLLSHTYVCAYVCVLLLVCMCIPASFSLTHMHTDTRTHTENDSITVLGPGTLGMCDTADFIVQGASSRPMEYRWVCKNSVELTEFISQTKTEKLTLPVCHLMCGSSCMCVYMNT
jgi:hypothetical protein